MAYRSLLDVTPMGMFLNTEILVEVANKFRGEFPLSGYTRSEFACVILNVLYGG